jgi:hypothetical protein
MLLKGKANRKYLTNCARIMSKSGVAQKRKKAQIEADNRKIKANRERIAKRAQRDAAAASAILETSKNLCFDENLINEMTVAELNAQLDFYRDWEKKQNIPKEDQKIKPKSHYKNQPQRRAAVIKFSASYQSIQKAVEAGGINISAESSSIVHAESSRDDDYDSEEE